MSWYANVCTDNHTPGSGVPCFTPGLPVRLESRYHADEDKDPNLKYEKFFGNSRTYCLLKNCQCIHAVAGSWLRTSFILSTMTPHKRQTPSHSGLEVEFSPGEYQSSLKSRKVWTFVLKTLTCL